MKKEKQKEKQEKEIKINLVEDDDVYKVISAKRKGKFLDLKLDSDLKLEKLQELQVARGTSTNIKKAMKKINKETSTKFSEIEFRRLALEIFSQMILLDIGKINVGDEEIEVEVEE